MRRARRSLVFLFLAVIMSANQAVALAAPESSSPQSTVSSNTCEPMPECADIPVDDIIDDALSDLTIEDCAWIFTEAPWTTDVVDCEEYVEGTASDATPLGAISLYAMQLEQSLGVTTQIDSLTEAQEKKFEDLVDEMVLRNVEASDPTGPASARYEYNNDEIAVCFSEQYDCWRARNAHTDAKKWAVKKFGSGQSVNTRKDAYRHCMWSALMTVRANENFARKMGFAHEEHEQSRAGRMDLHNNSVGRLVGKSNGDQTDTIKSNNCVAMAYSDRNLVQEGSPEYGLIFYGHGI